MQNFRPVTQPRAEICTMQYCCMMAIFRKKIRAHCSALGWVNGLKFCMCTMGHHGVVWFQFQPDLTAFYFMALNCVGGYLAIRYSHRAFQYTVLKPWPWGSQKYIAWPERVFSPTILEFEECAQQKTQQGSKIGLPLKMCGSYWVFKSSFMVVD